jgi:probable F420-dependent oxidoreductase
MQFGAHLPTYWNDYGTSNMRSAIEEGAKAAEALGYDAVWANDSVMVPVGFRYQGQVVDNFGVIEPLITLASLVHLVPRIKLGTHVLVLPQRDAIIVAKQVAALDLLSESRLIFGVGVGWRAEEFKLLNADFERRGAVADEAIEVMRTLWRDPVASFHGQFYDFSDALFLPKPAGDGPPLWVGGNTAAAIHRAARIGDAWIPWGPKLDEFKAGVASLRELTAGRRCPMIAATLNLRIDNPGKPTGPTKSDQIPITCPGSPDAIVQYLDQYRQAGLEYALCGFNAESLDDLLRQMRIFAEQVAPQFAEAV